MERCFWIFCVLFSAFIVPGLFTEKKETDPIKKAVEEVIQDQFIEDTLRELYGTDNEGLTDVKEEEPDTDDDALLNMIRAFMSTKRLRQTGIKNIYERWDDLHGRGTDTTTRRTTGEETTSPKSTAAATETTTTTTTTPSTTTTTPSTTTTTPSTTTTTTTPSTTTTTTTTPSTTTTTTTTTTTSTTTTPSPTTTTSTTTPPPPPINTTPPVPALVTETPATATTMTTTTSSPYFCRGWGWWSWLCNRRKYNRISALRKLKSILKKIDERSD